MQAVILNAFGDAENLVDAPLTSRACGPGDVRISVKAVSFNPIDYQLRAGPAGNLHLPYILGFDIAGIITEIGAAVIGLSPGDDVMAYLGGPAMAGGYADEVVVPAAFVAPKPRNIGFAEAAAIPLTGLTALQSLRRAGAGPTTSLLVAGAAGGAGSWMIRVAQARGVTRITATAGREESRRYLSEELGVGADRLIDHRDEGGRTAAAIAANGGRRYDIAVDCAGAAMTRLCCEAIALNGHVVSIVNGPAKEVEELLFERSAAFHSELVYAAAEYGTAADWLAYGRDLAELAQWIEADRLLLPRITVLGQFNAGIAREAHRMLESGKTLGKLVATLP